MPKKYWNVLNTLDFLPKKYQIQEKNYVVLQSVGGGGPLTAAEGRPSKFAEKESDIWVWEKAKNISKGAVTYIKIVKIKIKLCKKHISCDRFLHAKW